MTSYLTKMLHGRLPTQLPTDNSRVVLSDGSDSSIRLTTGSMSQRVLGFLYLRGVPCQPHEIAVGVNSNLTWAKRTLHKLITHGEVLTVPNQDGLVNYALSEEGKRKAQDLPVLKYLLPNKL